MSEPISLADDHVISIVAAILASSSKEPGTVVGHFEDVVKLLDNLQKSQITPMKDARKQVLFRSATLSMDAPTPSSEWQWKSN